MSKCYTSLTGLVLFFSVPGLAAAQTLEDKVLAARRLQAQSILGVEQGAIDSLVLSGRNQAGVPTPEDEAIILDSLIAGPTADSGADSGMGALKKPRMPKRYEQRIFQSMDRSAFTSAMGAVGREYVLGPGDAITVSLWGDKEKQYRLTLNTEGSIFFEGVGLIPVSGLNSAEAEKKIRERLSRIYSGIGRGTTSVNLTVGKAGPKKVFVLGEFKVPGGYVFTGHTSVLAALYTAQGPTDIGTVRNLILNRAGKKIVLDLYEYLMRGEAMKPDVLQDGDVLFAGRAEILVEIGGDVGRAATYEMKRGESLKELLLYAGGLNATAATQKMTLQRVFPNGKIDYLDLPTPQEFLAGKAKFELRDGDKVLVEKSSEPTRDFYTIAGPVKYPGTYQAEGALSVQQLIGKAGGLREEAFLGRVHVIRPHPDGSSDMFSHAANGTVPDTIVLQPRDSVILYNLKDMLLPDSVEIAGAVFNPGRFEFRRGMTVKDLAMQAGGFRPEHESGKILVFRGGAHERKVEQKELTLKPPGLDKGAERIELQPYDFVHVPMDPRWYLKEVVTLEGLFLRPGKYALLHPGEKLADVIQRAGGFKPDAYVEGARFFRYKDSVGRVGVDVAHALRSKRSPSNIQMLSGDSLFIPKRSNTVKVIGEVGFETSVLFQAGASARYYIDKAGGFTRRSEKGRVVLQYANGESSGGGAFARKPDAGSVIYVPQGPEPKQVDWFVGINALLGTSGMIVALILSIQAISQ